jgi:NADH:ubiquinone oxidoreductase subunit E
MDSVTLDQALSGLRAAGGSWPSTSSEGLLEALRQVQARLGYLPPDAIEGVAKRLRLTPAEVYGVATFFTNFRLTPRGKVLVRVCRGTACHVRGGDKVRRAVEVLLGLAPGQTSDDLSYTYETVNCVGACALAPTMVVEDVIYGEMTPERASDVLASAREAGL